MGISNGAIISWYYLDFEIKVTQTLISVLKQNKIKRGKEREARWRENLRETLSKTPENSDLSKLLT